jgi:hypothetical protein
MLYLFIYCCHVALGAADAAAPLLLLRCLED